MVLFTVYYLVCEVMTYDAFLTVYDISIFTCLLETFPRTLRGLAVVKDSVLMLQPSGRVQNESCD